MLSRQKTPHQNLYCALRHGLKQDLSIFGLYHYDSFSFLYYYWMFHCTVSCEAAVTVKLEVTSHDNLGGVDIPWWKQTNTTRLASHLDGRARVENYLYLLPFFYLDTWGRKLLTSSDTQIGWDLPMGSHKILARLCKSWPI